MYNENKRIGSTIFVIFKLCPLLKVNRNRLNKVISHKLI